MKHILPCAVSLLLAALILALIPTDADAAIYRDTVRLHVLAHSDDEEEQALKLKIRDDVLAEYGEGLLAVTAEAAAERVEALLPEIENFVNERLAVYGSGHTAAVTFGEEYYETREYEGFTMPAGVYPSLRILIGDAEGHNWWCVLYPPLCLGIATERAAADDALLSYNQNEIKLITGGGYRVKFRILEVFSSLSAKKS